MALSQVETEYKKSFENFLAHTDEKAIFLKELKSDIEKFGTESLLDIGAGNGLIAIPLSQNVKKYLAIEHNEDFANSLQKAGLDVLQKRFPISVDEKFDMVLACHAISYTEEKIVPFLEEALNTLKDDGVFLIVTYRETKSDWNNFLEYVGDVERITYDKTGFDILEKFLSERGTISSREVFTTIQSDNFEDMFDSFSFLYSDGKKERADKFLLMKDSVKGLFDKNYKKNGMYSFVFRHLFMYIRKFK